MNTSYIYSEVESSPFVYPLITPFIMLGCYGLMSCICIHRKRIANNIVNPALQINRISPIRNNNHNDDNDDNDDNSIPKIEIDIIIKNDDDDGLPSYNELFNKQ